MVEGLGMSLEYQLNLIEGLTPGQLAEKKMLTLCKTGHPHAIVSFVPCHGIVKDPAREVFHDLTEDILAFVHNIELLKAQS